ncbi:MAG: LysM peptidoglycan-binding domain-containing protein [Aggregatilineales bacterium]
MNRHKYATVGLIGGIGLVLALEGMSVSAQGVSPVPTTAPAVPPSSTTIHVVQRGEDLFQIAQEYGTTVADIARANGINNAALIQVGQRLLIPNAVLNADAASAPGSPTTYVVGPGDSLQDLAWRYGTTPTQIALQNRIVAPTTLYIGLSLAIPAGAGSHPAIPNGHTYVVQPGDTLYRVAALTGQPIAAIADANGLSLTAPLFVGQTLAIPANKDGPVLIDAPPPVTHFAMRPSVLEQGRTVVLEMSTSAAMKLSGTFLNHALVDNTSDGGLTHYVFIGDDAFTTPGVYSLQLTATDANGHTVDLSRNLAVADGHYNSEQITLPPTLKDLLDPKITQPELDQLAKITAPVTSHRYFTGAFGLPVPAAINSQFGTRRSYDGQPYNQFHAGTDFAAAPGAAIYAPMPGIVVFTGLMHVRGNITIIDHGWGIYTAYCHQSQILVNVGDAVQAGQIIGKIGSTGRVTGPHLHWELYVNSIQVDPMEWARISFP